MSNSDTYLATGFRNVDGNSDIEKLSACLQFMNGLPSFSAYKAQSFKLLRLKPGNVVVDLGCRLGFDVRKIADEVSPGGLVIGVDKSSKLLEAAKRILSKNDGIRFEHCDIRQLLFDSNSIDAIRIDRTLQHVEDPQTVITEMARVLKPGGWLTCAEPDWFTFVIDSDDIEKATMVAEKWRSGFRNPSIGRQLARRIQYAGLTNISVDGYILLAEGLNAINTVYDLFATINMIRQKDETIIERLDNWRDGLIVCDKHITVRASVTLFLACGQKQ